MPLSNAQTRLLRQLATSSGRVLQDRATEIIKRSSDGRATQPNQNPKATIRSLEKKGYIQINEREIHKWNPYIVITPKGKQAAERYFG